MVHFTLRKHVGLLCSKQINAYRYINECNSVKVPNDLSKKIYQFALRSHTLPYIMNTVKKINTRIYVKV